MGQLPDHLFLFPSGRACLLDRAIVFNSCFTWRMALPRARTDWPRLTPQVVHNIARLARQLKPLERYYSGRGGIVHPPFRVRAWWNPRLPCWSSGRRLMLAIPGERCMHIIDKIDSIGAQGLSTAPALCDHLGDWIEVLLASDAVRQ